jgi:hypothetical protein
VDGIHARFVVSAGRSGSTLLSSVLAEHPAVLSLREVFAALQPRAFPDGLLSAERFWRLLSEPQPAWTVALRHRIEPPEFLYRTDGGGRFDRQGGVPPILGICLPAISGDPDDLYGELERLVTQLPAGSAGALYESLFDSLRRRMRKEVWVERSGGSLQYVGQLAEAFGRAKFLHLHRSGRDTALSMSRHTFFRMALVRELLTAELGFDPYEDSVAVAPDAVRPELAGVLPDSFDPAAFWRLEIPLERFGRRWSATILHGTRELDRLAPGDVLDMAYEDLIADPRAQLARVVDFFELPDPPAGWYEAATARVLPPRTETLPAEVDDRLRRACEPGERCRVARPISGP